MMNETIQHECAQGAMLDFEEQKKLTEDYGKGQIRKQEITKIGEIHSREDKRNRERTKRFVASSLTGRWWRRMNLDESYRVPSLFTWRC